MMSASTKEHDFAVVNDRHIISVTIASIVCTCSHLIGNA